MNDKIDSVVGDENRKPATVQYFVYESEMARQERHIRRLWILCLVIFAALVISNAGWIWYESQFEDVVVTQENGDAPNNYIGNDGSIFNGADTFGEKEVMEDGEADH